MTSRFGIWLAGLVAISQWITPSAHAQELFVVHLQRFYLAKDFRHDVRANFIVDANRRLQDFFCERGLRSAHVVDRWHTPWRSGVPVPTCKSNRRLRSLDGELSPGQLSTRPDTNDVVVTGLYFGQCHRDTTRSVLSAFMREDDLRTELRMHFPVNAIAFEWDFYREAGLDLSFSDRRLPWTEHSPWNHDLVVQLVRESFLPYYMKGSDFPKGYAYEILVDGQVVKSAPGLRAAGRKRVQFHFWSDDLQLINHLSSSHSAP